MLRRVVLSVLILIICITPALFAENGVSDSEIILGQSCALAGPASALGLGMKAGLLAAFESANEAGGINGRKIKLISLDDGYEPEKAITNTRLLIEQEKVFMLIGEVGTPTSKAVVPIAVEAKVPFFGPFTGAEFLRDPFCRLIINVRGSYNQEMEKIVEYLVDKKGIKKIACFYQDDGYGLSGLEGLKIALEKRTINLVGEGNYKRNTMAVKRGLLSIRKSEPEAIVMVGAYKPCAEFMKLARSLNMNDVIFCNISFVGSSALTSELGDVGDGSIISQVMPLPDNRNIAIVDEYNRDLAKYQPTESPDFTSLEGYVVGRLFCQIAAMVPGELTREKFLDILYGTKSIDLGGLVLNYDIEDNQGAEFIFLSKISDGKIVTLE